MSSFGCQGFPSLAIHNTQKNQPEAVGSKVWSTASIPPHECCIRDDAMSLWLLPRPTGHRWWHMWSQKCSSHQTGSQTMEGEFWSGLVFGQWLCKPQTCICDYLEYPKDFVCFFVETVGICIINSWQYSAFHLMSFVLKSKACNFSGSTWWAPGQSFLRAVIGNEVCTEVAPVCVEGQGWTSAWKRAAT